MKNVFMGAVFAVLIQGNLQAQQAVKSSAVKTTPTGINSIEEAVESAVKNHPALSATRKSSEAARSGIAEAEGELYPSIDFRSAVGREENENSTTINAGDAHRSLTRFESSLLVRQSIYAGGRISNNISRRRHASNEAFFLYLDEKEKTVFNAIDAYLGYSRTASLIVLAKKNVQIHQNILKIVNERKKRGMSRDADVIQVKGRLALAQAQYQRELANKYSSAEQFIEAVGNKPGKALKEAAGVHSKLPKSLPAAKMSALSQHPLLTARQSTVDQAHFAVKESDAAFRPQLALELRAQENDNVGGTLGNDDQYSAMLVLNWNLFRGGADKAIKVSRLFQEENAKDLLFDEKGKVIRNVAVSWHDYKGILVELNYFMQHEKASFQTLKAYQEQYKLNKRTLFDLLNAQNELFLASSRVIETKFAKVRGIYSIFGNMGNISSLFMKAEKSPEQVKLAEVAAKVAAKAKAEKAAAKAKADKAAAKAKAKADKAAAKAKKAAVKAKGEKVVAQGKAGKANAKAKVKKGAYVLDIKDVPSK